MIDERLLKLSATYSISNSGDDLERSCSWLVKHKLSVIERNVVNSRQKK